MEENVPSLPPPPSSSLAEEEALQNDLIMAIILAKCGDEEVKSLRLVAPVWNDVILSSKEPRLLPRLPMWSSKHGFVFPPLEELHKQIDGRLVKKLLFLEKEFPEAAGREDYDYDGPNDNFSMTVSEDISRASLFQLRAFCDQFGGSIQQLTLRITEFPSLQPSFDLMMNCCPNLTMLEIELSLHDPQSFTRGWQVPTPTDTNVELKKSLVHFKMVDKLGQGAVLGTRELYHRIAKSVLAVAPNLERLFLALNFFPVLETQRKLRELVWENTTRCGSYDETEFPADSTGLTCLPNNFTESLMSSAKTLESLKLRLVFLRGYCPACQVVIEGKHMYKLLLPNLKSLVIDNPMLFMLDGGIGFEHFSKHALPKLEALGFRGKLHKSENYQLRLRHFVEQGGGIAICTVRSLDLGQITPETSRWLGFAWATFPNLTSLSFILNHGRQSVAHRLSYDTPYAHGDQLLKSIFNNCCAIETLRELKISCYLRMVDVREVIRALRDSELFKEEGLRSFTLDFGKPLYQDNLLETRDSTKELQTCAMELTECFLRTNHMDQVLFRKFVLPPTVLIPVWKTIQRLHLPVSFGEPEGNIVLDVCEED